MLKLLRSYFFWTYERGSLHYDVMVTLILLFLFLSPRFIDYRDQPDPTLQTNDIIAHTTPTGTIYQVRATQVGPFSTDDELRANLLRILRPIAGPMQITRFEAVRDIHGQVISYNVWVAR